MASSTASKAEPVVLARVRVLVPPVTADETVVDVVQAARIGEIAIDPGTDRKDPYGRRAVTLAPGSEEVAAAGLGLPRTGDPLPGRSGARTHKGAEVRQVVGRVVGRARDDYELARGGRDLEPGPDRRGRCQGRTVKTCHGC